MLGPRAGLVGAAIATLNPYLIWHDVHVNREIVDQVVAAALVLLTLIVAERPSLKLATLLGAVTGLSMLGNTRLDRRARPLRSLPRVSPAARARDGARLRPRPRRRDRRRRCPGSSETTSTSAASRSRPTDARCGRRTTRARTACSRPGQWIDNIGQHPPRPPHPGILTPDEAHGIYVSDGRPRQARSGRVPRDDVLRESRASPGSSDHPGDKAKLAALSAKLLWQPNVFETSGRPGAGTQLDVGRRVVEPVYMWIALRARCDRPLRRAARVRRARAAAARLSDRRRARLRRRDAVPRRLGLPARDPRRGSTAMAS